MPSSERFSRRALLTGAGGLAVGSLGLLSWTELRQPKARVFQARAPSYEADLLGLLREGLRAFPAVLARARGGHVVLKPNLVEVHPDRPINTDPRFIAAVAAAFLEEGAGRVTVAEGAGHTRDAEYLLERTGLEDRLRPLGVPFVDLNVDEPAWVRPPANLTKLGQLPVARTVMQADLFVSLPKLKTHHWAGVTLSMKNLFGTVPGHVFGWPKNPLHWAGIHNSIVDLWSAIRPGFAIVDGIVGMEGDGPIMGSAVPMGLLAMSDNLPALDAHLTRLMALRPEKLRWFRQTLALGGTLSPRRIERLGDGVEVRPFAVLDHLSTLRG